MGQEQEPFYGTEFRGTQFHGAKVALFIGAELAVILRDARDDIPWPAHWDFPGGGREGDESPLACALRETREELGLSVAEVDVVWRRRFEDAQGVKWFFVAHLPACSGADIRLGDEGQRWTLMAPAAYCAHPLAIPPFAARLQMYLEESGA